MRNAVVAVCHLGLQRRVVAHVVHAEPLNDVEDDLAHHQHDQRPDQRLQIVALALSLYAFQADGGGDASQDAVLITGLTLRGWLRCRHSSRTAWFTA